MSIEQQLPPLERETLGRILRGEDPWNGFRGSAGISGRYSQAVNRLKDKGYIQEIWNDADSTYEHIATDKGRKVYGETG